MSRQTPNPSAAACAECSLFPAIPCCLEPWIFRSLQYRLNHFKTFAPLFCASFVHLLCCCLHLSLSPYSAVTHLLDERLAERVVLHSPALCTSRTALAVFPPEWRSCSNFALAVWPPFLHRRRGVTQSYYSTGLEGGGKYSKNSEECSVSELWNKSTSESGFSAGEGLRPGNSDVEK